MSFFVESMSFIFEETDQQLRMPCIDCAVQHIAHRNMLCIGCAVQHIADRLCHAAYIPCILLAW